MADALPGNAPGARFLFSGSRGPALEKVVLPVRTVPTMNTAMLELLIPIIAILATFGFPVALVFVWKWFKLKDRELQVDSEIRRTAGQALESRVQRLESVILALDADLRARLGESASRADLFESPATSESSQPGPLLEAPGKTR